MNESHQISNNIHSIDTTGMINDPTLDSITLIVQTGVESIVQKQL